MFRDPTPEGRAELGVHPTTNSQKWAPVDRSAGWPASPPPLQVLLLPERQDCSLASPSSLIEWGMHVWSRRPVHPSFSRTSSTAQFPVLAALSLPFHSLSTGDRFTSNILTSQTIQ